MPFEIFDPPPHEYCKFRIPSPRMGGVTDRYDLFGMISYLGLVGACDGGAQVSLDVWLRGSVGFSNITLNIRPKMIKKSLYCRSGNFPVLKVSRISNFKIFHEVKNSRIFIL